MKVRFLRRRFAIVCYNFELENDAALEARRKAIVQRLSILLFWSIEIKGMSLHCVFVAGSAQYLGSSVWLDQLIRPTSCRPVLILRFRFEEISLFSSP